MTLRQLQYFCTIAAQGWNISRAAKALHTSQPGISRQMRALEDELRVLVFVREKNRIVGLTEPGEAALLIAKRITRDFANFDVLRSEFDEGEHGTLTIAATHTQARYIIPSVLEEFMRTRPGVQLFLKQGVPPDLVRLVASGEADLSLSTAPHDVPDSVVMLPCFAVDRIAVMPPDHPLIALPNLRLEDIARYPLITYDPAFVGRSSVLGVFDRQGLKPRVAVSAVDTDVMKAYALQGLGVVIMSEVAYDPAADRPLHAIRVSHLFGQDTIYVGLRRYSHLRRLVMDFVCRYAPKLTPATINAALSGKDTGR